MVNLNAKRTEDILKLLIGLVAIVWLNIISGMLFSRFDLTEEKRYSIKPATKEMLSELDDKVYVEVLLGGELNASFRRLQRAIGETLEEFRIYSENQVQFSFVDPAAALTDKARGEYMQAVIAKGIQPTNVIDERDGDRIEKLIFPGALISFGGVERGVMLLGGNQAASAEEKINASIESIEYNLAAAIQDLTTLERKTVGIVQGHQELDDLEMASLLEVLRSTYLVKPVSLSNPIIDTDALLIAKPKSSFTEQDKYHLDQYLMNGGKVLLFVDKLQASMDSVNRESNYSFPYNLNLDDQLFKYGVRINNDLIQDNSASGYPVNVGNMGDQPQIKLMKWWFYPIINRFADHVTTKNLDAVIGKFVSTLDTIKADGVSKTPLFFTSDYSRSVTAPVNVSLQDLRKNLTPEMLNESNLPVAYLLEGTFTSLYKNRFKPEGVASDIFKDTAEPAAKVFIMSDGDFVRNDLNPRTGAPQPLGLDPFTGTNYANQDFVMNLLNYMLDEAGLITARGKEIKIRPLDKVKIKAEKTYWQVVNLVLPMVLLVAFGLVKYYLRKRKYTGYKVE